MDRTSSFPNQDFEGLVSEIWLALNGCLYHAAYVKVYANTIAMHLAGSRRRHTVTEAMSQAERDQLQEDVMVFRAHFAGVLWQLNHLGDELLRVAYRRCEQEGIVTKERHDASPMFSRPWMRNPLNKIKRFPSEGAKDVIYVRVDGSTVP